MKAKQNKMRARKNRESLRQILYLVPAFIMKHKLKIVMQHDESKTKQNKTLKQNVNKVLRNICISAQT